MAKLGFKHPPLMDALASACLAHLELLNPHNLAGTARAYATLAFTEQRQLLLALGAASAQRLAEFNSQDLANSAWCFATCQLEEVGELGTEVLAKLPEFAPQGLATTAWAYSNRCLASG